MFKMKTMEFRGHGLSCIKTLVVVFLVVLNHTCADETDNEKENIAQAMKSTIDQQGLDDLEKEGAIRYMPPVMDEEESHSIHMPKKLRCDGCKIIAYQLATRFNKAHERRPSMKSLTESEVIDILDDVCSDDYDSYGVKEIDGVKRLTGPGTETADAPGIMQGGGRWPNRLRGMCNAYVGELEEFPIYQGYLQDKTLIRFLCEGEGILGECLKNKGKEEL
ncbi:hypothetical protein FSP39_023738 [Pinctada imbricata]|uniref:Uncharacterized protein n=1 Tax=Pinctada imbricata TaxID=66713 RepID=A0AA88Y1B2_PINIB|nr:hypothetical protein FSP39_023738 [Pinctada imbricata]